MQFFATILAIAALACAALLPRGESVNVNFDGHQIDAAAGLGVINDLLSASGVSLKRGEDALSKRTMVPGLKCGYQRAEHCAGATSGVLVACIIAAIETGKDVKQDASCIAAATAFGSALPTDCRLCLGVSTTA